MSSELLPDENYPFDNVSIKTPKALQGGTYSAQLELNNQPLVIQTPKCKTKKGIHKTSKQIYCDLLFSKENTDNISFINWLDTLQGKVRDLILENGDNWFHEKPSLDEVEYNWNDSIRSYKGSFNLIRTFIGKNKSLNKLNIQIYDDNESELHLENIDEKKSVICILEIKGLKFSSQSFHLEIYLRQVMILNEKPIFSKCLIKTTKKTNNELLENSVQQDVVKNENINFNKDDNRVTNNKLPRLKVNNNNLENLNEKETTNIDTLDKNKKVILEKTSEHSENTEKVNLKKSKENLEETKENLKNSSESLEEPQENLEEPQENLEEPQENLEEPQENLEEQEESLEEPQESLEKQKEIIEKKDRDNFELQEIKLDISNSESIKLKNANDVYLDIYRKAREKAKQARNEAIKAYLEVKRIKELYMLDVADSSDDDEIEEYDE